MGLKKSSLIMTAFCLLYTGLLSATLHPSFRSCRQWEFDAEFLYLLPSMDDTYFVINAPATSGIPNGTRENNDFNFKPAFRIGGTFGLCDNRSIQGYYTHLYANQNETISGNFLWATQGSPDVTSNFEDYAGFAASSLNILYQQANVFFDQPLWCTCGFNLDMLAGVEFAYIRFRERYDYQIADGGPLGEVNKQTRSWGIGPQLGLVFAYDICHFECITGGLSVVSSASASILATQTKEKVFNSINTVPIIDVTDQQTWRLLPALHARVGLNYATYFSCFGASLEVGYEFNSYLRALTSIDFPDDAGDSLSMTHYSNFDTQGLYIALGINF